MDIRNIVRSILPFPTTTVRTAEQRRAGEATDREGNGQEGGQDQRRRHLSDAEIQMALQNLGDLPGVKENGLVLRLVDESGIRVVYVEDTQGKVVRRIPEADLSLLVKAPERKSGHLLNKAL